MEIMSRVRLCASLLFCIQEWIVRYKVPAGILGVARLQLTANREVKVHQEVTVLNVKLKIQYH